MKVLLLLALAGAAAVSSVSDPVEQFGPVLAQTRAFAADQGDRIWPGYGQVPFGFLLLEADREVLLCQPNRVEGFDSAGAEPATGCARFTRARTGLPSSLLAAMPIFGPPSTIVMGTPGSTGRSTGAWLRTILHEHFHQFQDAQPRMFERTDALGLSGSDRTGMWMLNYPFPYADVGTGRAYGAASQALAEAIDARGNPRFASAFDAYLAARSAFQSQVSENEWRYIEFELWKEGVARWTEITLGRLHPNPSVREAADDLARQTGEQLRSPDLARQGREFVYPYGAGEAMLLEACHPEWRQDYFSNLAMGPLLTSARHACRAS